MSVVVNYVVTQKAHALSAGIAIVRQILKDHQFPDGFTTKRIFELSQSYPAPPGFKPMKDPGPGMSKPPRLDHPVRSVSFLKTMILPALEGQQEIASFAQARSGVHPPPDLSNMRPIRRLQRTALATEFVWKVVSPEERGKKVPRVAQGEKQVGAGVGASLDTSHLNKRRQKARVRNVTEAVLKLKGELQFPKELKEIASTSLQ